MAMQPFFSVVNAPFERGGVVVGKRNLGVGGCAACGLASKCESPRMEATGSCQKGIFILAEAPGKEEDQRGTQLVGKSGKLLRKELRLLGIDLDRDCRKMNAVNCRPPGNKTPTDLQIACCRKRVLAEIKATKPAVILALGGSAMKSLCQYRAVWDTGFPGIMQWQGARIPDQEFGAHIVPTWHPAFILRQDDHPVIERRWRADLEAAVQLAKQGPPRIVDYGAYVQVIIDTEAAARKLQELYGFLRQAEHPAVAFDYETTGLKPYVDGHKCFCVSLGWRDSNNTPTAISCLLDDKTWPWLVRILRHPAIGKRAHNMKFEQLWSLVRGYHGGFSVNGWEWDSMLAAHVLDNRTGICGLKFQTYLHFGVLGYEDEIAEFIKTKDKNSNTINKVESASVRPLLLYCANDSLFEFLLSEKQKEIIAHDEGLCRGYKLLHDGALALVDAEHNGIVVDLEYIKTQINHVGRQIDHLRKRILKYEEVQRWKDRTGPSFNLNSTKQLREVLTKDLGVKIEKTTESGEISVDKETLDGLDYPFVKDLLRIRKLEKIKGTYLLGYMEEAPDGYLHPFYHLHKVISYRGSCANPNFQNIPKRDEEAQRIVRRALKPRNGFMWMEVDYSGIEVRVAATYHKDPTMIAYLNDDTTDMHRDTAADIFLLQTDKVTKKLRQGGKNGFVFPQFYGDYYVNCAKHLWHDWVLNPENGELDDGMQVKDWLAQHKINDLEEFTAHVRDVEDNFWGRRFRVYDTWRRKHYETYLKRGYFRNHTGFKYTSVMTKKDAINYGVQGSAFHCLLRSFIKLNEVLKREGWRSFVIGQIHDAIDLNVHPSELSAIIPLIRKIMVVDLCEDFTWINVPIDVEFDLGPINASWYEVKGIEERPEPCACGLKYGYKKKGVDGVNWMCPICDYKETA